MSTICSSSSGPNCGTAVSKPISKPISQCRSPSAWIGVLPELDRVLHLVPLLPPRPWPPSVPVGAEWCVLSASAIATHILAKRRYARRRRSPAAGTACAAAPARGQRPSRASRKKATTTRQHLGGNAWWWCGGGWCGEEKGGEEGDGRRVRWTFSFSRGVFFFTNSAINKGYISSLFMRIYNFWLEL